jgi:hypothetical protein
VDARLSMSMSTSMLMLMLMLILTLKLTLTAPNVLYNPLPIYTPLKVKFSGTRDYCSYMVS